MHNTEAGHQPDQPLRVLQVGGSGGVGCEHMGPVTNVVGQIASHMHARGLQVTVMDTLNPAARPRLPADMPVIEVETPGRELPDNYLQIQANAERLFAGWAKTNGLLDNTDVVHVHHAGNVSNFRKVTNKPIVYTCHTPSFWLDAEQYKSAKGVLKLARLKWQEHFGRHDLRAIRDADVTVALGRHLAEGVKKLSPRIDVDNKIAVIPNGLNMQEWQLLDRAAARQALAADPHQFRLVCVGRVLPYKGVHILLQALAQAGAPLSGAHLDIIGPSQNEAYAAQLQELARGLSVTFHGFIANRSEEFRQLMCAADLSVMPSLNDNQPTVILESLAYGLPVVSSRVGASGDMLDDTFGRLFKIGDAQGLCEILLHLHEHRDTLADMGRKARTHVENHFTWEASAEQYADLFRRLTRR